MGNLPTLSYLGGLAGTALGGALLSWIFQTLWETYLLNRATDITGVWKSSWRPNNPTERGKWCQEEVTISKGFGRLKLQSRNNDMGYQWVGYGKIFKKCYVQVQWRSLRPAASNAGLLSLTINPQGTYLFGVFHAPNDEGRFEVGPCAMGRDEVSLAAAKERLKSLR
ncbi:MAG TPA: hypothetical protein VGW40_04385 [Allosphingosinicella sp.]|nr:hypothetical protein [Allosphingosinicella sp.]